jgi:hypothetical protein
MTYKILSEQNKYLHGQLEQCTLMMGHCLLNNQDTQYSEFAELKIQIKQKIETNLQLIWDIWHAPIIERPAKKSGIYRIVRKELEVIAMYTADPTIRVQEIAKRLVVGRDFAEQTINQYITKKYGEIA